MLLARMSSAACLSFTSRSVVEDHYRKQVSETPFLTVLSSLLFLCRPWWESRRRRAGKWEREALPSRRRLFRSISCRCCARRGPVVFAGGEHSPGDAGELIRHSDHQHVARRSGFQCVHPGTNRKAVSFYTHSGCARAVDQNLAQVDVAALADAQQLGLTARRVLSRN